MERFNGPEAVENYNTIAGILVFRERKEDPGLLMRVTVFPYASKAL